MPDINCPSATIVIVVPGHYIMGLTSVEPSLDVIAELLMTHGSPAPYCPVLYVGWQEVGKAVRLEQHISPAENMIKDESLTVSAESSVHP